MSFNKVMEAYKDTISLSDAPLVITSLVFWIIIAVVFIIHLLLDRKTFSILGTITRVCFLVANFLIIGYLLNEFRGYDFSMDEKQWKHSYLKPYIHSLPEYKYRVGDFSQLLNDKNSGTQSIYMDNNKKPVWIEVSIVKKGGSTKKITIQAVIQKESIDESYLTYKKIDKSISDQYNKETFYETILHIPKEYKVLVVSSN
ncbi:hypothetical protein [Bacillus rubiinfantis]|uniref:hypothetical protein n=1 Tax=Bacillus rubiinfantis TaxID=1499680 RepID=UPI0005AAE06D|nr:hypothetical protein [Bacillus rubiinfantis]